MDRDHVTPGGSPVAGEATEGVDAGAHRQRDLLDVVVAGHRERITAKRRAGICQRRPAVRSGGHPGNRTAIARVPQRLRIFRK